MVAPGFEGIHRSRRHKRGITVRFPRMRGIRHEADTLDRLVEVSARTEYWDVGTCQCRVAACRALAARRPVRHVHARHKGHSNTAA